MLKLFIVGWILIGCHVCMIHQLEKNSSESDFRKIGPLCYYFYSCGVDFPILIQIQWLLILHGYGYIYCPWCKQAFRFKCCCTLCSLHSLTGSESCVLWTWARAFRKTLRSVAWLNVRVLVLYGNSMSHFRMVCKCHFMLILTFRSIWFILFLYYNLWSLG